jgi:hypothetical protein
MSGHVERMESEKIIQRILGFEVLIAVVAVYSVVWYSLCNILIAGLEGK